MEKKYYTFSLSNGMRVVYWHRQGALVSYIGAVINAGSRDEDLSRQGLAHFVEHTIFKGTDKRRSWQISSRMESVGGELNAYTSKEETMIYTSAPSGYEERATELIADLVMSSRFPHEEIERERDVVIEEIYSYLDSPAESVFDEFEELAYEGSGLAHNILGTPESVKDLTGNFCREFLDMFYTPKNMVLYGSSSIDPLAFVKIAEKYFGKMDFSFRGHNRICPPPLSPFDLTREKGNHQANTIVGARTFGRKDPRRFALFLLNNYLGGPNMNSRLNRELREKRGYVYTVDSSVSLMSDTGLMVVYFGCDKKNIDKCKKIIRNEIDRLCQNKISPSAFEKIKKQYCGQLLLTSDHIENRSMALAKSLMYFDVIHDISTTAERIMEVTPEELMDVAQLLAPDKCGSLTLC